MGPYVGVVDQWLVADKTAPRKQRHTARRVWQRLVREHGATLSEVTVSRYVKRRRVELGLDEVEVFVPQEHLLGREAEVDFGEFFSVLGGVEAKLHMFAMRLSASGKAFHMAFMTQAQEAFLLGHVLAFAYFGGVPTRIRYDNLKPAVTRVLMGRNRQENERFVCLRSHYGQSSSSPQSWAGHLLSASRAAWPTPSAWPSTTLHHAAWHQQDQVSGQPVGRGGVAMSTTTSDQPHSTSHRPGGTPNSGQYVTTVTKFPTSRNSHSRWGIIWRRHGELSGR